MFEVRVDVTVSVGATLWVGDTTELKVVFIVSPTLKL